MEQAVQNLQPGNGSGDISLRELYSRLGDKSLIIVDVLPREAYLSGHIPGARSLPVSEVSTRASEVIPAHDAEIAVYCGSST